MKKLLVYLILLSAFLLDSFQVFTGIVPRQMTWATDILSIVALGLIGFQLATKKRFFLDVKYLWLISIQFVLAFIGIILNDVSALSIVAGIRVHFKYLPFFFLPVVYIFTEKELKSQLKFIVPLLLLQVPVSIVERFFTRIGKFTGDVVMGTLGSSGVLSIVVYCAIAVVFGFYLKKRISLKLTLFLSICLFFPSTINETKVSVFLLPMAIIIPLMSCEGRVNSQKLRKVIAACSVLAVLFAGLVFMYNSGETSGKEDKQPSLFDFFTNTNKFEKYLYTGSSRWSKNKDIRRVDSMVLTIKEVSKDAAVFVFGRGLGYTQRSYLSGKPDLKDNSKTSAIQYRTSDLTITIILWEFGLMGVILFFLFIVILYRDTLKISKIEGMFGSFALGWSAVVLMLGVCAFYTNTLRPNSINIPFWYFCGMVASRCNQLKLCHEYTRFPGSILASRRKGVTPGIEGTFV